MSAKKSNSASGTADREIVLTRVFDAPRELVFKAWSDPEHLVHWWGPKGFTNTFHEFEMKAGGVWRFMMHGPDGTNYPNRIVFLEVIAAERLVYKHDSDEDNDPCQFEVTVTFAAEGNKTRITMRLLFPSAEECARVKGFGAVEGGNQTLDRLAERLTNMSAENADQRQILITRVFDAPRELVFKAWTDPKYMTNWYAPRNCTINIRSLDFRVGGTFHHCISNPTHGDCWCKGVYREIIKPEKIVYTLAFADEQGNFVEAKGNPCHPDWPRETTVTVTFEEHEGKTKMTLHQTALESLAKTTGAYPSWLQMMDRLAEELAKA